MALTHLVDTSALTRLRHPVVRSRLLQGAGASTMAVSRLACLELGFSARKATEWDEIQHAVTVFTALETSDVDTQMALRTQRELAARGKRGRKIVDLLVAATAMRLGLTVLHYDRDFDHISAITGQRTEWVAKAGSID